jgi:hypothetical protein
VGSYDDDGAGGVVDALGAHRTQEQAAEAATSSGADDEQVGAFGRLDQVVGRAALDDDPFDS